MSAREGVPLGMKRVKVLTLASGDSLSVPVYTISGRKQGAPSVYLQSAMHGSEVQGSLVLALLLDYLEKNPPLGNVRIVPNCNPVGLNNKRGEYTDGRNDPVRGDNWNRKYFLASEGLDFDAFLRKHKNASEPVILGNSFLKDFEELCTNLNSLATVFEKNTIGGPGNISPPILGLAIPASQLANSSANMLSKIKDYKSKTTTTK